MHLWVPLSLLVLSIVLMVLEFRGLKTTLHLTFKGDIKRETAFLAQYGQSVATPIAAALVWSFDLADWMKPVSILAAVSAASLSCFVVKRLAGRVRPNRENAGRFLGPSWKHDNQRESFPSSHSACAVALSAAVVYFFPPTAAVLWSLAVITAVLRWVLDAHFPSDVLAGCALGYAISHVVIAGFGYPLVVHW
jgi:undecaprenyl-diphosphatase